MKHVPYIDSQGCYRKTEINDDFLFRKTKSVSINAENLEECNEVIVHLLHRGVIISASKEQIKEYGDVKIFTSRQTGEDEVKYYLPIEMWKIESGDVNWCEKLGVRK